MDETTMHALTMPLRPSSVASVLLASAHDGRRFREELAHARAALNGETFERRRDTRQDEMRDLLDALTGEMSQHQGRVASTFPTYLLRHIATSR